MGSLVSGWSSHTHHDHKSAVYNRCRSLTKEEIEAYWRSKKRVEEDHLKAAILSTQENRDSRNKRIPEANFKSSSIMMMERRPDSLKIELDGLEDLTKNGWWTRSFWAFLNQPPKVAMYETSKGQAF